MSHRPAAGSALVKPTSLPPVVPGVLLFAVVLSCLSCSRALAQTTTTLVPSSYVTTSGSSGGQAVASSIDVLDETGTTNTWTKYVEFQTTTKNANYAGYQLFTLPTSIAPTSVTAIQVKVNYQGPSTAGQTWTWQLYDWSTPGYVTVGTNAGAPAWGAWTVLTFNASGNLARFVHAGDGQMKVQLLSNNHTDNCDIDYEAVVVTSGSQTVAVSLTPTSASVQTGATQQFTATVTGSSNTAVNWQVNGVAGGNSTVGTISASGLYTGPATVPSPAAVTVKAISQADTTKSASATVTVTAPAAVSVSVSPSSASVQTSATQQFTATVTGSSNTAVTWQVNGVVGGNSAVGTVTAAGLYAAPSAVPSPATVTVTAVSQADTTKSASASVTITAGGGGISYYVSTTGNNSNSGTSPSTAWKTITYAISQASAGVTLHVLPGPYPEFVNINKSGSASGGYITLISDTDKSAIIDGTNLAPGGQTGLVSIASQSYVIVKGFEIRNFKTTNDNLEPLGIFVSGAGSNIQILNNHIHDIANTGTAHPASNCGSPNPQAHGVLFAGNMAPGALTNITVDGNELDHMTTGCSETMTFDGNVDTFTVTNNLIHDNNNIGIDAAGFFSVSPNPTYDQARNGYIALNTVYNITSNNNPVYAANCYCADGIYVDGGTNIKIERNVVHNVDIGIEMASENSGRVSSNVIARSNLVYFNNSAGISIGGYQASVGGSSNVSVVNNTLLENDSKNTGAGEFQVQFNASNNIFENNIVYAGSNALFVHSDGNQNNPVTINYNRYFSSLTSSASNWTWATSTAVINYTGFAGASSWQSTGNDLNSLYADPLFMSLTTPDLRVSASSPAVNTGNTSLGASVFGTADFAGNARVQGANIDIGAYEQ